MSSTVLYNKYPPETQFGDKAVLNIGCGFAKLYGKRVVNIDAFDNCQPDIVWDLNKTPLPFQDETFDLVLANHILEHLPNWWETFEDLVRVTKVNGRIEVWVPAPGTDAIWGFRDHVHEINANSFFGVFQTYRSGGNAWAEATSRGPANRAKMIDMKVSLEDKGRWWLSRWTPAAWRWFCFRHLRNVAHEVGYIFRKVTEEEFEKEEQRQNAKRTRIARNYRAV